MTGSRAHLGDSHNFGRRVSMLGKRVVKPRTLLWEWLVLAADSPLRRLLDEAARRDGLAPDSFGFLPSLEFFPPRARALGRSVTAAKAGGEVERIALEPLPRLSRNDRRALAVIAGRSTALFSWLGVCD